MDDFRSKFYCHTRRGVSSHWGLLGCAFSVSSVCWCHTERNAQQGGCRQSTRQETAHGGIVLWILDDRTPPRVGRKRRVGGRAGRRRMMIMMKGSAERISPSITPWERRACERAARRLWLWCTLLKTCTLSRQMDRREVQHIHIFAAGEIFLPPLAQFCNQSTVSASMQKRFLWRC